MSELLEQLKLRFGEHRVSILPKEQDSEVELIKINLELRLYPVTVIMTHGLCNYEMPVPNEQSNPHIELFACLPSYWDWEDLNNPKYAWPFEWLTKLSKHLIEKKTWFGAGHTFSNGTPPLPLSSSMKMEHLMLFEPILLEEHLSPLIVGDKTIHFLAVCPIFDDEFEYKRSKGTFKFLRKYRAKNNTELIDDFRQSVMKFKFGWF